MADYFHSCVEQFWDTNFSVLEVDPGCVSKQFIAMTSNSSRGLKDVVEARTTKKLKLTGIEDRGGDSDEHHKVSHISVERNRRKQMNEHLSVLRSLMPCFYVKRGDQASIIGGVVDYITELQQVLRSLEAKKKRKVYSESALSPSFVLSPRKPPLSPRLSLPISPRTPQSTSSYRTMLHPFMAPSLDTSPAGSDTSSELVANSRSAIAEVEVNFVGGNLVLKTCSNRIRGQTTKVIDALENLSLEVLHTNISVVDEVMVNSFTIKHFKEIVEEFISNSNMPTCADMIKIGVECHLSADELVQRIQATF